MIIETSAPTRVDLAGGTVDIWPLYLFHRNAVTVNFAVDLPARCRVESRSDRRILLRSIDTGEAAEFEDPEALGSTARLKMLARPVHFFKPAGGLELVTECTAPAGSGLAGSSALDIAVCGALNRLTGAGYDLETLVRIAKNIEAQVIDVPTGDQDYYPAAYGGLQAIHLTPLGVFREEIPADLERLSRRLVLVYSGRQRNSGINNWDVMKRHIDGDALVRRAFEGIVSAANGLLAALRNGDYDQIDGALDREWENRRLLSDGITTPEIDSIIAKARSAGAGAAKICGAGGGGCILLSVPEGSRKDVEAGLRKSGIQVIDYGIDRHGLSIRTPEK